MEIRRKQEEKAKQIEEEFRHLTSAVNTNSVKASHKSASNQ
jgi:hypothetical protein